MKTLLLILVSPLLVSFCEANKKFGVYHLDWLCLDEGIYARNVPWDCSGYIICSAGIAYSFHCPASQTYNAVLSTCEYVKNYGTNDCIQNPFNYLDMLCLYNPGAKIESQESCAQYFDCSQRSSTWQFSKYVLECPYPDLFSSKTGRCENFRNVKCGARKEPKAPCDYVQYKQICADPGKCSPCNKRHPTCLGYKNGFHPIPTSSKYFMFCFRERTLLVKKCHSNTSFSYKTSRCV
ncbi:hypothetical protein LOTGIDRAFT_169029 [Lottia gigantea]|uniref:Chitin-binding type-2 domain-containing protein n=1 Tax=Lottia gigantea TaxID=225164 RepID=V3ZHU5_LOTGI|nr:hypothetical protein LOTGIDRAFT_169029 [Lottia gigantea]ESO83792.1 hypothetical protein LOTGIDRAFT_169029 [Lottia gigantea]